MSGLTFVELKEKERRLRSGFPETMGLRVHRAISWIGRAQKESDDPDAAFLFFWIAFNAAYADERDAETPVGERRQFADLLRQIVRLDNTGRLHAAVSQRFPGPIRKLLENRYVFRPFWLNTNGVAGYEDWQKQFVASANLIRRSLIDNDTARVLHIVFDRLYVLRCQIMHGGTTWGSYVNRDQVKDGAAILGFLMPVMVDVMLDNPEEDWGRPLYPVVGAPRRGTSGSARLG
jgi:hypothetical protein